MLRSEHSLVRYDFQSMRVFPDRLRRSSDAVWLSGAEEMIQIYRRGIESARQDLHAEVERALESLPGCVPRRIAAFCKLLDDASEYHKAAGEAASLRRRVFGIAADMHPIVQQREGIFEHSTAQAQRAIADQLQMPWDDIAAGMFADVIELQRLRRFDESIQPAQLLSRYNVAQTQAALYKAVSARLDFTQHAPRIVRLAKLAGLMHRIIRVGESVAANEPGSHDEGYSMILDGPGSVLRETSRYGIRYAQLVASLLSLPGWSLRARVRMPNPSGQIMQLSLSPRDGLRGEAVDPEEFDSQLERQIQQRWQDDPVAGWTLDRDREFLTLGQQVYTPDFVLHHRPSRRRIFIEVLGFWTPEYLRDKSERLKKFSAATPGCDWLLMLDKKPTTAKQTILQDLSLPVLILTKSTRPNDWIEAVRRPPTT